MTKRLKLEEMQELARVATRRALADYTIPDGLWEQLVLGVQFVGDERVFELYVPNDRPEDALVISQTRVHSITGECEVKVLGLERKRS